MSQFWRGFGFLILYFITVLLLVLVTRKWFSKKSERFRKLLHFGAQGSILVLLYGFAVWWHAVIACGLIALLFFAVLHFAERLDGYATLLVQRKPNEVKWSMVSMFVTFGIVIAISKGLFASNYLAVASVFAWGFGDAAAALVGKRFGKNKLRARMIEGDKSVEGSVAMAFTAFAATLVVLLSKGATPWYFSVLAAAVAGVVSSVVELYTRHGADTITCPLAALFVLAVILLATGGVTPVWM